MRSEIGPGLVAAALIAATYGGFALSVDFPRAAIGFQSDEATYYMMGHSLAADGDLVYRREDLVRVWREFPGGPAGLFLKRGSRGGQPDPDQTRYYYGKSFMYPLLAAPLIAVFGTNGFLLLHALLMGAMVLAGYAFLSAHMPRPTALVLSTGFLMASVAPVYFVWITPELLNLAAVLLAYFFWLYKEVAPAATPERESARASELTARGGGAPRAIEKSRASLHLLASRRWLIGPPSDLVAAILLAIATCSKPSNGILIAPMLAWMLWRRRVGPALAAGALFAALVVAFFGINVLISGEWNFQGGDRRTFYGAFPFQTPDVGFEVGLGRTTNRPLWEIIFGPDFWTVLSHNLVYFFIGRYSGLVPYFFPAVFALVAFFVAPRRRPLWQWLVLVSAVGQVLIFIITIPYNYLGGGGVVGNRYFMNAYGLFLFLLPPLHSHCAQGPTPARSASLARSPGTAAGASLAPALVMWMVGSLFTAQLVFNPFVASFRPAEAAKAGPYRWLPVELTLVNDLPINTDLSRVRQLFGERPRFQIYFLDDNAYAPEGDSFWVRGESTAELLIKSAEPARQFAVTIASGPSTSRVEIEADGEERGVTVQPGEIQRVALRLDEGFPYQGSYVWKVSISCDTGFVPMFEGGGKDNRYLGVRVKPELVP